MGENPIAATPKADDVTGCLRIVFFINGSNDNTDGTVVAPAEYTPQLVDCHRLPRFDFKRRQRAHDDGQIDTLDPSLAHGLQRRVAS